MSRGLRNSATVIGLAVLPLLLLVLFLASRGYAFDFEAFWQAGKAVRGGRSPYPDPHTVDFARALAATSSYENHFEFVYPAPALVSFVPLSLLPFGVAAGIFTALGITAIVASLRLLDVRDWRCYGAAFLWFPTLYAVRLGTVTPLLVLGLAAAWRYRDRRWIAAPALAAIVIAKVFLWPILLWFAATRRTGTAVLAAAGGAVVTAAAWAVVGFDTLRDYPALLGKLSSAVQGESYSPVALGLSIGLPPAAARVLAVAVGVAALLGVVALARRPDGDRLSFLAALAACFAFTPIVWNHYFALLLVPIAVARPRLSPLWFVPALFWTPPESDAIAWKIALTLAVVALALVLAGRTPSAAAHGLRRSTRRGKLLGAS